VSVVVDASAAVALVLNGPAATTVRAAVENADAVVVPQLYAAEVASALWKYVHADRLTLAVASAALSDAIELVDRFVPGEEIATEALHEAARSGHPVYDLLYLVTARRIAATLVTCDRRLRDLCETAGVSATAV
jgi:predicted nucleic acid-binding protein